MWTAANAFGVNEWFLIALHHRAAAALAVGDAGSDTHVEVAARCVYLIDNGTYPMRELLGRTGEALQAVNGDRRRDPAVMALRFALARRTGDRAELAHAASADSVLDELSVTSTNRL